jgi:hypothetical protein
MSFESVHERAPDLERGKLEGAGIPTSPYEPVSFVLLDPFIHVQSPFIPTCAESRFTTIRKIMETINLLVWVQVANIMEMG